MGNNAGIWFGTPESFINLGAFMPPGVYFQSIATSVAELNGTFYVGGYASLATTGEDHAFLWVGVPSPGAGTVLAFGLTLLLIRPLFI